MFRLHSDSMDKCMSFHGYITYAEVLSFNTNQNKMQILKLFDQLNFNDAPAVSAIQEVVFIHV